MAPSRNPQRIIQRILEKYPTPPDAPHRDYDVHDRKQAKAVILRKLKRRRNEADAR